MGDKVALILDYQDDPSSLTWDLRTALLDTIKRIDKGEFPNKGIVIGLEDRNYHFYPRYALAGMLSSQAISLMEVFKVKLARDCIISMEEV